MVSRRQNLLETMDFRQFSDLYWIMAFILQNVNTHDMKIFPMLHNHQIYCIKYTLGPSFHLEIRSDYYPWLKEGTISHMSNRICKVYSPLGHQFWKQGDCPAMKKCKEVSLTSPWKWNEIVEREEWRNRERQFRGDTELSQNTLDIENSILIWCHEDQIWN